MSTEDSLDWYPVSPKTEIELKFDKISQLEKGWRYGEGEAPKSENIERARRFNALLEERSLHDKSIFPGVEGDLTLELYFDDHTLEITFENDRTISCSLAKDDKYIEEKSNLGEIPAVKYLIGILKEKCKSYDSYTSMNTIDLKRDSHQYPFRIYVEASPSSAATA